MHNNTVKWKPIYNFLPSQKIIICLCGICKSLCEYKLCYTFQSLKLLKLFSLFHLSCGLDGRRIGSVCCFGMESSFFFPFKPQPHKYLCMGLLDTDTMSCCLQVIYLANKTQYTICPRYVPCPYMALSSQLSILIYFTSHIDLRFNPSFLSSV